MMISLLLAATLQSTALASEPEAPPVVLEDFAQLPIEEATGPRCGVVFAIVEGQQSVGESRATQWPDLAKTNGREFFVRAMAKLMDDRKIGREQVARLVERERATLSQDDFKAAYELMEPCLLMKQSVGL
jgi:hypothetical protein